MLAPHGLETNPTIALLRTVTSPLQTTKFTRWRLQRNQDTRDEVEKTLHAYLMSWKACRTVMRFEPMPQAPFFRAAPPETLKSSSGTACSWSMLSPKKLKTN